MWSHTFISTCPNCREMCIYSVMVSWNNHSMDLNGNEEDYMENCSCGNVFDKRKYINFNNEQSKVEGFICGL